MTQEQRDKLLNPTSGSCYEMLPPITIEGVQHMAGLTIDFDKKTVEIIHKIKNAETNKYDFASVKFDFEILKSLIPRLMQLDKKVNG